MATSTKSPEENQDFVDSPAQTDFDEIIDGEFSPDEVEGMESRAEQGADEDRSLRELEDVSKSPQSSQDESTSRDQKGSSDGESWYKSPKQRQQNRLSKLNGSYSLKKYLIIGGFSAAILSVVILIFGFLNVFKLDGLMSSIEQRAFLRTNATLDTRSSKLISAYVEARMLDMGDNPNFDNPDYQKDDNLLFRAKRVDTNSPFLDWYKTLRTSQFEQQVFEKHGIKFTSMVTADGKFRTGLININGEKPIPFNVSDISTADFNRLSQGDIATIRKFGNIVDTKVFDTNKDARKAIKQVVKANTRWDQVFKRRALRKAIQNMTGVKDWRFFETTRDNLAQKRIDIRTKIIDKMVPDTNLLGQVTRCLFGLNQCKPNRDVAAPQNKALAADITGTEVPSENNDKQNQTESKLALQLDEAGISDALKKVLQAANIFTRILNIPSTLDMLSYVNKSISNLVKFVVIARGAQAAGLFQVFETSRDQLKTGQVTSPEVNDLMNAVSTAASSDGYAKVIEGKGDPSIAHTDGACSQKAQAEQEKNPGQYQKDFGAYAPLCADQRIGSAANAQQIQDDYSSTIKPIVGPIVSGWSTLKDTPIIGTIINVLEQFSNLISKITTPIIESVLSALGLKDNIQSFITWVFSKVSNFIGLTILKGYESSGTFFNWLVQGGSYTAESAARQNGAAITNNASQGAAQSAIAKYESGQQEDTSLYNRLASLSDPSSPAFKGMFALSNLRSDPAGTLATGLQSIWQDIGKSIGVMVGRQSLAAAPNGYAASQFAGIETYDYPQQCYDMNPITAQPIDGTNAMTIFQQFGIAVSGDNVTALNSWDTETNSDLFYQVIYNVIQSDSRYTNSADDVAIHIYNCNLLDTTVRGSLGYVFGYTKDNNDLVQ